MRAPITIHRRGRYLSVGSAKASTLSRRLPPLVIKNAKEKGVFYTLATHRHLTLGSREVFT